MENSEYIRPLQTDIVHERDASDVFRSQLNEFAFTAKSEKHSNLSIEMLSNSRSNDHGESRKSAETLIALAALREPIKSMLKANNPNGAAQEQQKVVRLADEMPQTPLLAQSRTLDRMLAQQPEEKAKTVLQEKREAVQHALAMPFTERFRLAAMQLQQRNLADAERTLDAAVRIQLPPEALSNETIRKMREDALAERRFLETTRSVPKFMDEKFDQVAGNDGFLTKDELKTALNKTEFTDLEKRIMRFMLNDYDKLIDFHNDNSFLWFGNGRGITRNDVNAHWRQTRPGELK